VAADPDLELLERWRAGDSAAGERLFDRHFEGIKRFFRNKVSLGVEDLVQQTFLTCVERKDAVRGDSTYRTYLFGVAHNVLRNHLRTKRRKQDPLDFGTISAAAIDPTPSGFVAQREERQAILLALREIPIQYQVILELHYWEQMDRNALARVLEIPPGTAASRLRRGRELLRAALEVGASRPALLVQTLSNLDDWAAELAHGVRVAGG
jgi:RNA polymerase sigma-70 factor (ECF subfamily)